MRFVRRITTPEGVPSATVLPQKGRVGVRCPKESEAGFRSSLIQLATVVVGLGLLCRRRLVQLSMVVVGLGLQLEWRRKGKVSLVLRTVDTTSC